MSRTTPHRLIGVLGAAALAVGMVAAMAPANAATAAKSHPSNVKNVCGAAKPGFDRCYAEIRTDVHEPAHISRVAGTAGKAAAAATAPAGFGPADLHAAYNLPTTGGANQTVAIVDAGDDPTAEADLAVYRSTYGLPACTTANGCFTKVNQRGTASPLPSDIGWGVEEALDLDMVSAACPQCKILLVEGDDADSDDLGASVDTAVRLGATEVSNSYGGTESSATPGDAAHYTHPGTAIVASSGDSGYGIPSEPAVFASVVSVGGTSLTKDSSSRGWSESAWSSDGGAAGSGCSAWVDKPAWQTDANCPGRMVSDVSADADPNTGPAIYVTDTPDLEGLPSGWNIVGGTSASSPFIAGVIALAGNPGKYNNASAFYAPAAKAGLNDPVGGSTGLWVDCGGDYQCTGVAGYDGPTGMGSPNGLSAF
ncbi:peptidase S8 and S53 subtilisin kexin sedolisin [Catenulispora acidiphila DSM 44928]|uniref:Peptidase S8 and S53 subtilisin kexin sedolisin n=1 Tax=Catenulispora acidiphila (strain DSM 44928 / JCM 14897 / NBRC 102108 / NRRL B-24433 / ID139908) TaxID=479433 RepID=C7QGT6_CATAD|nr:S8 family serine peptidase [Catenulispora acidiphila]ACU74966.1 peptidase S8 and S53 subtilisin kexin sedolisin [Catenulispora acidiphila DSM 44928]